jgi:hypothetical protein
MLVAPFASASSHTVLLPGDTVHCRLRLGAAMAPCTRRGPSVPLCGSLWPSLDRRPTAPPACSCRCALAPPIGCGTSSPPLRTPARDASKSCPPADHPQTLGAALCSALLSHPQRTAHQQATKQAAGRAVQRGIPYTVQCSAAQLQTLLGTRKASRRAVQLACSKPFPPSTPDAALLLFPFPTRPPRRNPDHPSDQTLRLLLATNTTKERCHRPSFILYNTSFARIQAYRLIVPLFSPPE